MHKFAYNFAIHLYERLKDMWDKNGHNNLMYMYLLWRMIARPKSDFDAVLNEIVHNAFSKLFNGPFLIAQMRYFWEMGSVVQTYRSFKNENLRYYAVPAWISSSPEHGGGSSLEHGGGSSPEHGGGSGSETSEAAAVILNQNLDVPTTIRRDSR